MPHELGVPADLDTGCLPTEANIYNLHKKLRDEGIKSGQWKNGTVSVREVAKVTCQEVQKQWSKTDITTILTIDPEKAVKEVCRVVNKAQTLQKLPVHKRKSDFGHEMNCLLDFSVCQHTDTGSCDCTEANKVPEQWRDFLSDQRGKRQQCSFLNHQRLRAATVFHPEVTFEEIEARENEKKSDERKVKEAEMQERAKTKLGEERKLLK